MKTQQQNTKHLGSASIQSVMSRVDALITFPYQVHGIVFSDLLLGFKVLYTKNLRQNEDMNYNKRYLVQFKSQHNKAKILHL